MKLKMPESSRVMRDNEEYYERVLEETNEETKKEEDRICALNNADSVENSKRRWIFKNVSLKFGNYKSHRVFILIAYSQNLV